MIEQAKKLSLKLEILLSQAGLKFQPFDDDQVSRDYIVNLERHNLQEYEKLLQMPVGTRNRIETCLLTILARVLQAETNTRYGYSDTNSIHKAWEVWSQELSTEEDFQRFRDAYRPILYDAGVVCNRKTEDEFVAAYVDGFFHMLIEASKRYQTFPSDGTYGIVNVLSDIMQEVAS